MDFKNNLTYRTDRFETYCLCGNNRYKYEKHGILEKCIPRILFKGNAIFVTFLQLIDMRIIMLFKYCDRIKNFKNFMKYE